MGLVEKACMLGERRAALATIAFRTGIIQKDQGGIHEKLLIIAAATVVFTVQAQAADLKGRMLKIGSDTTYPPMETVDEKTGRIVGFDVDVADAIRAKINCTARFVTTAWDGIFAALVQGEFDMVVSRFET
jgi:ABC-type amino acid transport substrate-binding protein